MTALRRLSEWAATADARHTALAYERAAAAFKDTLGCIAAGAPTETAERARATVAPWGGGRCTVVGQRDTAAPPWAAFANGVAAHVHDYDDYDEISQAHSSAVLVPAVLAAAEAEGAPGQRVLDAYIVGLEIMMRMGEAMNLSHYNAGWHATSTLGVFGAAAACARLFASDATTMQASLSLAASLSAGPRVQFGTAAKPLHAGFAAQNGLLAASLARHGLAGHEQVLDGEQSFLRLYAGGDAPGYGECLRKLGEVLAIDEYGLVVKRFPNCGCLHRSLDGLLALRASHRLDAGDVESVTATVPKVYETNLKYPAPETPAQARFSMHYGLAVAVAQGEVTLADYTEEAVLRPEIRALLPRMTMATFPVTEAANDLARQPPEAVEVLTRSGERLRTEVSIVKGDARNPLSADELSRKFRRCASALLAEDALDSLEASLDELDGRPDLSPLMGVLRRHR